MGHVSLVKADGFGFSGADIRLATGGRLGQTTVSSVSPELPLICTCDSAETLCPQEPKLASVRHCSTPFDDGQAVSLNSQRRAGR
jgi:hypothetical protein